MHNAHQLWRSAILGSSRCSGIIQAARGHTITDLFPPNISNALWPGHGAGAGQQPLPADALTTKWEVACFAPGSVCGANGRRRCR